ncbi:MAG: hypothetical protein AAFO69_21085, partial [Bacteroidota bacterium]
LQACKNRDVNPVDLETREMHETILPTDFDSITVNGIDYLLMERDRNNPHEGFGFMALNGRQLIKKQDSILAYQQLILENQIRILQKLEGTTALDLQVEMDQRLFELMK